MSLMSLLALLLMEISILLELADLLLQRLQCEDDGLGVTDRHGQPRALDAACDAVSTLVVG